ncbi:MAG TPA: hypothetical protein VGE74_06655 [Gemmata sp.]
MTPDEQFDRLHRDLNLKRLNPLWAKAEIVLGLVAVAAGLLIGMKLATRPEPAAPVGAWLGPALLIVLGGYLALAGHRSHLYQSNNRLASYLAHLIRTQQKSEKAP